MSCLAHTFLLSAITSLALTACSNNPGVSPDAGTGTPNCDVVCSQEQALCPGLGATQCVEQCRSLSAPQKACVAGAANCGAAISCLLNGGGVDGGGSDGAGGALDAGVSEGSEGGSDSGGEARAATAILRGTTVSFATKKALANATISAQGQAATSNAQGAWSLTFAKNTPFSLNFTAPMTAAFHEQEAFLTGDFDLGNTNIVDATTAGFLTSTFPSYDSSLGVLALAAESGASTCPANDMATNTVDHATFSVDAPGASGGAIKFVYLRNGFPSTTAVDTKSGESPALSLTTFRRAWT